MAITKVTSGVRDVATGEIVETDLASTLDLSGKTVTLPAASVTAAMVQAHAVTFDDNQIKEDIALLAFKQATSDSLVKYDLVDQTIDVFTDASGINAGSSTNETRDSSGKYYSGTVTTTSGARETITATPSGGTWTAPAGTTAVEVLVVAGGGAGGSGLYSSGGGGAGGLVYHASKAVTAGNSYTLTVGAGGTRVNADRGGPGGDSVFSDITANGGGGGGSRNNTLSLIHI